MVMSNPTEVNSTDPATSPDGDWRVLFLDDDPLRAEVFLSENPGAVWVTTVEACLAKLAESWNEVHLDHDLGGEQFVDVDRDDCGMAVVRWLCNEPRAHLRATRFVVHTHNPVAGNLMMMMMEFGGYQVEGRPFGAEFHPLDLFRDEDSEGGFRPLPAWLVWLRTLGKRLGLGTRENG